MKNLIKNLVLFFLIVAPLIDYTYSSSIFETGTISITPPRLFKLLPILLFIFLLPVFNKSFFLNKKIIFLLYITLIPVIVNISFESLNGWIRLLSSFIFFLLAGKLLESKDINFLFQALLVISLIPLAISFLQYLGFIPYTDFDMVSGGWVGRVSGGYLKPNSMLSYLVYTFTFGLCIFYKTPKFYKRVLLFSYLFAVIIVVFLTYHRVSFIIFGLIFLIVSWLFNKKLIVVSSIVLVVPAVIFTASDFVYDLFMTVINTSDFYDMFRGRMGMWSLYLSDLFSSNAFNIIFGNGNVLISGLIKSMGYYENWNEPHSDIIRILYQYGILGFSIFVYIFIYLLKQNLRFIKMTKKTDEEWIGYMGVCTGLSLVLYSITTEPTRYPSFYWYYAVLMSYMMVRLGQLRFNSYDLKKSQIEFTAKK